MKDIRQSSIEQQRRRAATGRAWTHGDAVALRADAEACPREIGSSAMLDMIVEAEGLGPRSSVAFSGYRDPSVA